MPTVLSGQHRFFRVALLVVVTCVSVITVHALPKFSLLTGNRCSSCHVSVAGGAQRNDLGWYSYSDVSVIPREGSFLSGLYAADTSNSFFDGKLLLGLDMRAQTTRSPYFADAKRKTFPMQGTLYTAFKPVKELTIDAQMNFFGLSESAKRVAYPGQKVWAASATWQPHADYPSLRIGQFRPAYGMRYDDHTMSAYSIETPTSRQAIVAPEWAEPGAELSYEGLPGLTAQVGVFGSSGIATLRFQDSGRSISAVAGNAPTIVARVVGWPRFLDDFVNTYIGASILNNGDFNLLSGFVGIGLTDVMGLAFDYTRIKKDEIVEANNFAAEFTVQVYSPILPFVRYEVSSTQQRQNDTESVKSSVIGAHIFVMPYVELRPEYRIWDTAKQGLTTRWNLQLHIFY